MFWLWLFLQLRRSFFFQRMDTVNPVMIVLPLYKEVWQGKKEVWFRFFCGTFVTQTSRVSTVTTLLSGKAFQSFMVGRKQTLCTVYTVRHWIWKSSLQYPVLCQGGVGISLELSMTAWSCSFVLDGESVNFSVAL